MTLAERREGAPGTGCVGVRKPEAGEDRALATLHPERVYRRPLVVEALQVQDGVHEEVRMMSLDGLALLPGLTRHDRRTDGDVPDERSTRR